jgi:superfamily II DNA or RNA helicase
MIGLTASPTGRSDKADAFGEALFGPILVDVSYQDGVKGGNIVPITVRMIDVPNGPDVSGRSNHVWVDRVGLWLNDQRNRVIRKSVRAVEIELGENAQILIMVDTTEHAYALGQYLPDYTVVTGEPSPDRVKQLRKSGAMSAQQEPCTNKQREQYKQAFEDLRLKRVIATKIWRQGVNFRDLSCLVRADGKASAIDSVQVPGRLSRLGNKTDKASGLLIDFMDSFSPNLANRSRKRMQVYRKNGWTVEQV